MFGIVLIPPRPQTFSVQTPTLVAGLNKQNIIWENRIHWWSWVKRDERDAFDAPLSGVLIADVHLQHAGHSHMKNGVCVFFSGVDRLLTDTTVVHGFLLHAVLT